VASLREYLNNKIKSKGSTLAKEKAKGKKHKSIAAAKKAGALYYTDKNGKLMAAVYAEDLKKPIKKSLKPRKRPGSGLSPITGTSGPKTRNQKARDREAAEVRKANKENRIAREQKEGRADSIIAIVKKALRGSNKPKQKK
jgi:glucose dehydrogenase